MSDEILRPRLVRFDDVAAVVGELRRHGIGGANLYRRVTDVGPVDLDLLNEVLRQSAQRA